MVDFGGEWKWEIGDPTGGIIDGNGGNLGNTGLVKGGNSKWGNGGNMGFGNVGWGGANGDIVGVNEVEVLGGTCGGDVGAIELGVGGNCDGGGDTTSFLGLGSSGDVGVVELGAGANCDVGGDDKAFLGLGFSGDVGGVELGAGANCDGGGDDKAILGLGNSGDVGVFELGAGGNCDGGDDKAFLGSRDSGDACGGDVRIEGNGGKGGNLGLGTGGTACKVGALDEALAVSKRWRAPRATLMLENNKAMKKANIKQWKWAIMKWRYGFTISGWSIVWP